MCNLLTYRHRDLLQPEHLDALLSKQAQPCVSIYFPTHRIWSETSQDRIRLKNLLKEAEQRLAERGLSPKEANGLLKQAYQLDQNEAFWNSQSDGLALFLSPENMSTYRLASHFEELVVVNDRFHIKPLLKFFGEKGRYNVLTLSQGNIRFLEGTPEGLTELKLPGVPTSLGEALKRNEFEKQQQFHSGADRVKGSAKRATMYHGQGGAGDDRNVKKRIEEYFKQVDNSVCTKLAEAQVPLVLAGLDHLRGMYRKVNHYKYISKDDVATNPEELSLKDLHNRTWAIVKPHFKKAFQEAVLTFNLLTSSKPHYVSTQIEDILPAAYYHRVKVLFVRQNVHTWGTFDQESQQVSIHEEAHSGDHDLIDLAVIHTLRNRGTVYMENAAELLGQANIAAILRH